MNLSNKSFHLRWNNHLSNLRTLLEYMYNEQSFVDVTLSCKDGLIKAHKLVLSACSPYFDSIFRENPCEHPVVILRGISLREIQLIIEYMYVGSVDIPEEELPKLLEVANELHVKGLVQDPADDEERPVKSDNSSGALEMATVESKIQVKEADDEVTFHVSDYANESTPKDNDLQHDIKEEPDYEISKATSDQDDSICGILSMAQVKMEEGGTHSNDEEKRIPDAYQFEYSSECNSYPSDQFCKICNRGFLSKQNMKRHMQTHSGLKPHQCSYCSLSFLRLSHLQRHHRVHTGERPFNCEQCDKQFSRSDKLKQHVAQHHSGIVVTKQQKQRGRPRKQVPLNIPLALAPASIKVAVPNVENGEIPDNVYQAFQQIYNIPTTVNGISVVQ